MLSSDSTQGIYAPLSQVMSDSDSEEEIHNSSRHTRRQHQNHNQHSHQQQQQQLQHQHQSRQRSSQQLPYHARNSLQYHQKYPNGNSHQMHHSSSMSLQNSFRSVMDDGSNFTSFNSDGEERHQTDADNVAILGSPETKDEPMTKTRKCCFIGSILVCIVTVVVFLWVIPCSEQGTCPAPTDRIKTHNWLNNYTKVELKGVINVVDGVRNWEKNLIFLYRGNVFFPELERPNSKRNGIISLVGSSGAIAWFDEMSNEPIAIDCTLIDVDKDGKPDCLVIDVNGELGVISPISGEWHWFHWFRVVSKQKVDVLDFPVILPDLDGDGVYDILFATIVAFNEMGFSDPRPVNPGETPFFPRNIIQILSGRKGKPIGDSYKVEECDWVRKFQLEKNHMITFNCVRNNTEVQRSKSLAELFSLVTNRSMRTEKLTPAVKISQHRQYGQRKETEAQRNIYSLSGRELVVENRGKCPEDCNVSFILSEERNGKVNVVKNFTEPGMYGMVPAQWHFQRNKSKMSGFVMKFWKWKNHSVAISARKKRDNQSDGSDLPTSEFNIFDHLVQKRHTYTIAGDVARVERSTANITRMKNTSSRLLLGNYKRQMITETVVLVIFIGADTRIENTSQSDIVQFCKTERTEMICQPDLNNQENSLLIADLDEDGSQELVSYYSTFKEDDLTKNWRLVTYVQLLRLESELPGFYGEGKRN